MDSLPLELKRKIADGCSLATLANLQIASKDWAKACRGAGAKFRKRTFRELYESEGDEIREYVAKNVYVDRWAGYGQFVKFCVKGVDDYGFGRFERRDDESPEECLRRTWRDEKTFVETVVLHKAIQCLLHPRYVTGDGFVPDDVEMSMSLKYTLRYMTLGDPGIVMTVVVKTRENIFEKGVKISCDSTIEDAHRTAWATVDERLLRRRSTRIAKRTKTFEDLMREVDMRKIVAEVA